MMNKAISWQVSTAFTIVAMAVMVGIAASRYLSKSETITPTSKSWLFAQSSRTIKGHAAWIYAIAFSPDGKILASGGYDETIKVWDVSNGELLHTLKGHADAIESLAISPDSNILASGSWDNRIKLWNLKTGNLINTLKGHQDDVKTIAISPDGMLLASGGADKTLRLWNLQTGELLDTFEDVNWVRSVAFSPDGKILASGNENGTIRIWQLDVSKIGRILNKSYVLAIHPGAVRSISFCSDGQTLASGSTDKTIKVWQLNSGKMLHALTGHEDAILSVTFGRDGQSLVSGSYDTTVKLWDLTSGKLLGNFAEHSKPVWSVAWNPQSNILASASGDETIKIWQISPLGLPQISYSEPKLEEIPSEITSRDAIAQLNQKLYNQIQQNWRSTPSFKTNLVYRVVVNQDGAIIDYTPLNQPAADFIQETSFASLRKVTYSHKRFGQFKVVLKPSKVLEVSPWHGWR